MESRCARCNAKATEYLSFSSRYKTTRVELCVKCFELAREVFQKFMKEKPDASVRN